MTLPIEKSEDEILRMQILTHFNIGYDCGCIYKVIFESKMRERDFNIEPITVCNSHKEKIYKIFKQNLEIEGHLRINDFVKTMNRFNPD
jgi:hypothetical protein